MVLGFIALFYFVFSAYIIWFAKKKPEKIWVRFTYSFLVIVFTTLLTNFSFSPQTSYKIKSFPFNLDRDYSQIIEVEDYAIVAYPTGSELDTSSGYDFYIFQKFLEGYIDSGIEVGDSWFENEDSSHSIFIKAVIIEEKAYFLLYHRDLAKYDSLKIGDLEVDLDIDLSNPFILFERISTGDEPLIITIDGVEYTSPFTEDLNQ